MTKHFHRELEKIKKRVLSLGTLVEERVRQVIKAMEERDAILAAQIIKSDHEIDEMEVEVEEELPRLRLEALVLVANHDGWSLACEAELSEG